MTKFKVVYFLLFLLMCSGSLHAQTISGVVKDKAGETLPGVSVVVKGSSVGTSTDLDGKFSLDVQGGKTLEFSMIGLANQDVTVSGTSSALDVTMESDLLRLNEAVVTALGIKREKKSLGYAMQEVKGDILTQARENNVANALSGKVSGLQIIRSSNGPGGSTKMTLRGNNSLTGSNQPLIVVDGVPMNNFTGGVDDVWGNKGPDMGSGIADINQDDIESMSVLKGGSAAALYGSRAGNGVILITTKSGRKQEGLGITVNSGLTIQSIFMKAKLQNQFGQGSDSIFDSKAKMSWGPKAQGQIVEDWTGTKVPLNTYDNIGSFFGTGVTSTQNISFQQTINKTSVFASVNRMDDKSMIPNSKLNKTSLTARVTTNLGQSDKWKLDVKANYINTTANNRPIQGINQSNAFHTINLLPRSLDILKFKNSVDEFGNAIWFDRGGSPQENPWWVTEYIKNTDTRDRLLGSMSLKYNFTDWLDGELKVGTDYYTTAANEKKFAGGIASPSGNYRENISTFNENNYSYLFTARKDNLIDKFGGFVTFGGNIMHQKDTYLSANAGELDLPNYFNINNGKQATRSEYRMVPQKINSLYGSLQANWDGYLFMDLTYRNDWSSTMSKANRSFGYPSASFSGIISEMITKTGGQLPQWLSFAKVRASYAEVGNSLPPFNLYNQYSGGKDINGNVTFTPKETLYDENVVSELIKSKEIGIELKFFQSRLGIDLAWYKSNATNQLMDIAIDPAIYGYSRKKVNAGNIQNQGWEAMINGLIVDQKGFKWDAVLNLSANENKIIALTPEVSEYSLGFNEPSLKIVARTGGLYGDIYGQSLMRLDGKILVDGSGKPIINPELQYVGNQQAKWLAGLTNNFTYKGINLSFLVDARFGGKIYSGTTGLLHTFGSAEGTVVNGNRDKFVVPNSVTQDGKENTQQITHQDYWTSLTSRDGNLGIAEIFTYDATNVRLRNISLGYTFDRKMLTKTPFQKLSVSASCNNVWMIYSKLPGIDPESVNATNTNAVGFELGAAPTSRVFSFNVTIGF